MQNLSDNMPDKELVPVAKFRKGAHCWHKQATYARDVLRKRYFMLEWHRRARKTTWLLNMLIRGCCAGPRRVCPYVGPTYKQAKKIAWLDPNMLFTYLPPKDHPQFGWEKNESELYIRFKNKSMLTILGADEPDTLRGIDAYLVGFDEWDLMKEWIWPEIFRPIISTRPERWAIFAYTPKGEHAYQMFDRACRLADGGELPVSGAARMMKDEWFASRLLATHSGIIPFDELKKIREDTPEGIFAQEYLCSRLSQQERTLITSAMIHGLTKIDWDVTRRCDTEIRKIVAVDPGFEGDRCVITGLINSRATAKSRLNPLLTNEAILEAKKIAMQIGTKNFIVDCIGDGRGVADGLQCDAADYYVQKFKGSHKPSDAPKKKDSEQSIFANKRAEAYYYTGEQIRLMKVEAIEDAELRRQLPYASRYKTTNAGKMIIVPKDKIKEDLGCSPDDADSYVMGIYGLQFVDPVKERKDDYGNTQEDHDFMMQVA